LVTWNDLLQILCSQAPDSKGKPVKATDPKEEPSILIQDPALLTHEFSFSKYKLIFRKSFIFF